MKVLMASPFDVRGRYMGGIATVVNTVINHPDTLEKNDIDLVRFETCRVERKITEEGSFRLSNIKNFLLIYFDLFKEIRKNRPDILYYHTSIGLALMKDLIAIRHAKKKTGIKVIVHIHYADYEKILTGIRPFNWYIMESLRKYADRIVFLSERTAQSFVQHGISRENCSVIYNCSTFDVSDEEIQNKWNTRNERIKLLFVGSLDQRKGILDILRCLSTIDKKNYILNVCGEFSDEKVQYEFKKYQEEFGEKIRFHGYVRGDNKKKIFLDSDVLILPSYGEGLPLVIMEAYRSGCAVLATNIGAIPEVLNEENGYLIQPGNQEQLMNALNCILNSVDEVREKQKKNVAISGNYTVDCFVDKVATVCKKTIKQE